MTFAKDFETFNECVNRRCVKLFGASCQIIDASADWNRLLLERPAPNIKYTHVKLVSLLILV